MGRELLGPEADWAPAPKEGTLSQGLVVAAPFLVTSPHGRALCWHKG